MVRYNRNKKKSMKANAVKKEKQSFKKRNEKSLNFAVFDKRSGITLLFPFPFCYEEHYYYDEDAGEEEEIEEEEEDEEESDDDEAEIDYNVKMIWKEKLPKTDMRKKFRGPGDSSRNIRQLKQNKNELYKIGISQNNTIEKCWQITATTTAANLPQQPPVVVILEEEAVGTDIEDNLEEEQEKVKGQF